MRGRRRDGVIFVLLLTLSCGVSWSDAQTNHSSGHADAVLPGTGAGGEHGNSSGITATLHPPSADHKTTTTQGSAGHGQDSSAPDIAHGSSGSAPTHASSVTGGHHNDAGTASDHQPPGDGHGDKAPGSGGGHGAGSDGNGTHHGNGTQHGNKTQHGNHSGHAVERFRLATIDFDRVSVPFIISAWVVFATLAKIGFHLNHKIPAIFPESCLLIVLGILTGLVLYFTNTEGYELQSDTFFYYLLPPIILEAGYFMPIRSFFDNIGSILCFAVVGTLLNTFAIGSSLYAFGENGLGAIDVDIDILHCLVFGAFISAVDPVAVLAVFDEVAVNEVLHICVFGESLLNDAVTVVLYHMMEGFSHIGRENIIPQDILAGIGSFFIVGVGGTVVGVIFGICASIMTRFTEHVRVVEPLIVFAMGYMSYIAAEIFHLSGIMACVFCGITMKKYVEVNISRKSHTTIKYFMKMIASLCETIIFMFLGMSTVNDHHVWNTSFVLFSLIFCITFRALGVIIQCMVLNTIRANKLNRVDQFIMAYGGLRGAIAFSLAVLLNEEVFPEKNMLITATLVVVYFTVFIQGTTIKPLVKVLRVKRADKRKPNMNEKIHDRLIDHMMAGIEDITGHFGHHEMRARFQKIDKMYIKPIVTRKGADKVRGVSIVQVYNKLIERDTQQYLQQKGSFISTGLEDSIKSFGNIFSLMARTQTSNSSSVASLSHLVEKRNESTLLDTNNSSTVLDMQALDAHESRKMKDDSKAHHILEDAMFKPRKRFHRHHRHMLPNNETDNDLYHHNIRKNLRHILSHSLRAQYAKDGRHHHHHGARKHREEEEKPRKNVSFANAAEAEVAAGRKPEDKPEKSKTAKNDSEDTHSHHSEDTDDGITFTVSKIKDADNADSCLSPGDHAYSPSKKHAPTPTLTELTLPWRSAGAEPVSMESIVAINGDDDPCPGEAPWVDAVAFIGPQPNNGLTKAHLSDPTLMETLAVSETCRIEEELRCFNSSAPQLARVGRPEPDIVNCSTPNEQLWTHKIDDFHEHVKPGAMPDLGALPYTYSDDTSDLTDTAAAAASSPMSGPDDCYLPATWRTTEELPVRSGRCDVTDGPSDVAGAGADQQTNLPPPWKSSPEEESGDYTGDSAAQKSNVVFELGPPSETASAPRSLPWETSGGGDTHVVLDMEEGEEAEAGSDVDQSSMRCLSTDSAPDADDCLPPPWRSVNVSEASLPVRSPSASHELDSLVPQASHNSLRLSEAESRHSEQFRGHHHVIDIGPRELEHSSSGTALSAMVGDDAEPLDLVSRVQRWLLDTKLDQQEPVPEDLYDPGPADASAADLSDAADCEDTYL